MLFCSWTKEIYPKMRRLCVCVIINKRSFKPFMCFRTLAVILVSDFCPVINDINAQSIAL